MSAVDKRLGSGPDRGTSFDSAKWVATFESTQALDCKFWGLRLLPPWQSLRFLPWGFEAVHAFNLLAAEILGADTVSTLIALLPSLTSGSTPGENPDGSPSDRSFRVQVVLMQRAEAIRDALLGGVRHETALLRSLLQGVYCSKSLVGVNPIAADPAQRVTDAERALADLLAAQQKAQVPEDASDKALVPLWGDKGMARVVPPLQVYQLVWAIIVENLLPLDVGQLQRRTAPLPSKSGRPDTTQGKPLEKAQAAAETWMSATVGHWQAYQSAT